MESTKQGNEKPPKNDKFITLVIKTTQGDWKTEFEKTTKVEEVKQAIIKHFGFAQNGNYELRLEKNPKEVLDPHRPLVSYHIEDGDCVIFTDLGTGV